MAVSYPETEENASILDTAPTKNEHIVFCSFYTDDDYYRAHADSLRKALDRLGIIAELEEMEKPEGADWADMTRRKIGILHEACLRHPDKKVFWVDIDCNLLALPDYVANSTADIIGFQRGFSEPLNIGYRIKSRFWEPCFFGVNNTPAARKFVADAYELEQKSTIKATDDYFFEESWRANADKVTFQLLPSKAMLSRADESSGVAPFFTFGSSGNVEEFKDQVVQHTVDDKYAPLMVHQGTMARNDKLALWLFELMKSVEPKLPKPVRKRARRMCDQSGLTEYLITRAQASRAAKITIDPAAAERAKLAGKIISHAQRGHVGNSAKAVEALEALGPLTKNEKGTVEAASSFGHYVTLVPRKEKIDLAWWSRPFPGNFGDWLSPFMISQFADRSVRYVPPTAKATDSPHIVSIGSIGRFIKPSSIVVGTGISTDDVDLDPRADYISLRGPLTAQALRDSGGPRIESFGDPGAALSRIYPLERGETNGRTLLVRHFTHAAVPLMLGDEIDELSVKMSHPAQIEEFLKTLNTYDRVVTSAMHIMIACHSYGIPVALVGFEGLESAVHGNGIKYRDYALGAGTQVQEPFISGYDLRRLPLDDLLHHQKISEAKLDEIELALGEGVSNFWEATA